MNEAWAVVAAALGSAFLTIIGSFWFERWHMSRAARGANDDRLREACVQLASHALVLALRAHTLYLTAVTRSGIGEGIDVALYHRKPADPMALTEWLLEDLKPMLQAQSVIEVMGDQTLIRGAASVGLAGMAVISASSNPNLTRVSPVNAGAIRRIHAWLRTLPPIHRDAEVELAMQQAIRELGKQLRRFASLTRERLGVNDPDAVIDAFPRLFTDAWPAPGGEGVRPPEGEDAPS